MATIRLSPKHGVNPCMSTCFWCGNAKNEILLLGRLANDAEAPHGMITDYEPCDDCKANFGKGVPIIEASLSPKIKNQIPISKTPENQDIYPTGRLAVVTLESANNALNRECELGSPILLEDEAFEMAFGESIRNP